MSSTELEEIYSLELPPEYLRRVVALTGAGISAESGVPTFRGEGGLWKKHRPEELATPQAFGADPQLVWDWYIYRRNLIAATQPNPGHQALLELESLLGDAFTLITQNVDGLHARAGSKNIIELHGNIFVNRCNECHKRFSEDSLNFDQLPPECLSCGGAVRPGVVWFGEGLDSIAIEDAFSNSHQATLFLSIGTSAVVHPAASLPQIAKQNGAYLLEINPERTPLSSLADVVINGSSAKVLPPLVEKIAQVLSSSSD